MRPSFSAGVSPARLALFVALLLVGSACGCRRHRGRARPTSASSASVVAPHLAPKTALEVPRADAPPAIDGELGEGAWSDRSARTGAFVDDAGHQVRPYSDARLLWHAGALDLALYAADQDIHPATDAFVVVLSANGKRATLRFGPKGLLPQTDPNAESAAIASATKVGVDVDGTFDDSSDDDEEWVIESTLPLAPLGLHGAVGEELSIAIERCDVPKGAGRICGHFGTASAPKVIRLR